MGSEGPPAVTIHVTGFKKFHGVAENPTETIVSNLKDYMEKRGMPKGLILGSCNVLEAAGEGGLDALHKILESAVAKTDSESSNSGQIICLHFGVNSGATRFAIEHQAINEANFRCADEMGWKPQKVPIVAEDGNIFRTREESLLYRKIALRCCYCTQILDMFNQPTLKHHNSHLRAPIETKLPVDRITRSLAKMGYEVMTSYDAGRFVCNYVYYHSLRFAEQHGIKSLFVHVPLFLTIDEEIQMSFAASLLDVLASIH